jgi:hypothetical protein
MASFQYRASQEKCEDWVLAKALTGCGCGACQGSVSFKPLLAVERVVMCVAKKDSGGILVCDTQICR